MAAHASLKNGFTEEEKCCNLMSWLKYLIPDFATIVYCPGASFTRFQTKRLQKIFPGVLADQLISYGSCQFPTLGFVVERYKQVQAFIPEPFWKLKGVKLCCTVKYEEFGHRKNCRYPKICSVCFYCKVKCPKMNGKQCRP